MSYCETCHDGALVGIYPDKCEDCGHQKAKDSIAATCSAEAANHQKTMKKNTDQKDPSQPDYWTEARDSIINLIPFYDPNHKCNIVREKVFKWVVDELKARTAHAESKLDRAIKTLKLCEKELLSANSNYGTREEIAAAINATLAATEKQNK